MKRLSLLIGWALCISSAVALAQGTYPHKPIRLVIGFSPGGAADYVARSMSDALGKALGQPVVVDNKPGNGSSLAADIVAKSAPDGYTVLIASPSSISVNPALNPKVSAKPGDLTPVTKLTTAPLVLAVNPATGIQSVPDLVARALKEPGKLNYASSGNGSAPHLGAALFTKLTGTHMTHIPYKGGSLALQSLMAGDTQVTFGTAPSVLPHAASGRIRVLAASSRERSALLPDLPGMREAGLPDYNLEFWYGLFVPAGTPTPVIRKLFDAAVLVMQQPTVKAALAREGTEVALSTSPEAFERFLVDDGKFWVNLVRSAKVAVD